MLNSSRAWASFTPPRLTKGRRPPDVQLHGTFQQRAGLGDAARRGEHDALHDEGLGALPRLGQTALHQQQVGADFVGCFGRGFHLLPDPAPKGAGESRIRLPAHEVGAALFEEGTIAFLVVLGIEMGEGQGVLLIGQVGEDRLGLHLAQRELVNVMGQGS